jgi:DivIVA domain-containing protein
MALAISILFIAGVITAVGLFAAGRIDGMSPAVPDLPPGLPEGPVTAEALRAVRIPVSLRGYRMADVDEMIERVAAELDASRTDQPNPGSRLEKSVHYEAVSPSPEQPRQRPSPYAPRPDVLENDPADG